MRAGNVLDGQLGNLTEIQLAEFTQKTLQREQRSTCVTVCIWKPAITFLVLLHCVEQSLNFIYCGLQFGICHLVVLPTQAGALIAILVAVATGSECGHFLFLMPQPASFEVPSLCRRVCWQGYRSCRERFPFCSTAPTFEAGLRHELLGSFYRLV